MRGHFLARSSLNLTELIFRLQDRIDNAGSSGGPLAGQLDGVMITDYADTLMAAFGGDNEQVEGAIGFSADQIKGLGAGIGEFGVRIMPVDGKINVNCAAEPTKVNLVANMIQSLLYPAAFDPVFEEEDAEGWRRDRAMQTTAILDYIDSDTGRSEIRDNKVERTSAPEDYGYENLHDTYKVKNNRIDSVSELKLVRGVDDRFWTLFGNAFRAYGGCAINLRAMDDPKVVAAVIALSAKDQRDPALLNPAALWAIANLVIAGKQFGFYFTDYDEFIKFVDDPAAAFSGLGGGEEGTGTGATPPPTTGGALPGGITLPPGIKGIVLDKDLLTKVAESKPVANFQVEAWGEVKRTPLVPSRRTLHAVWNQKHQNQEKRNELNRVGAWLYLREE
jgi:general secretion pathway protein K